YITYYVADIFPFLLVVSLILFVVRYIKCRKSACFSVKYEILLLVFYVYLTAMLLKTIVPEEFLHFNFTAKAFISPDKIYIYNNPEQSYINIRAFVIEKLWFRLFDVFILNLIMLVPFGFLFPIIYPKQQHNTVFYGIIISCFIETVQLFLPRLTDTFDVFLNTLGLIIGYLLFKFFDKRTKLKDGDC
ncbi:MAG: VanZ family protein, partial [Eubacterium sp.]|nr:VanZ family protein [Eubacterium sp.]